jgi:hypothetical protein
MGAVAYGLGLFWYGLVLGRTHESIWRTAAYPFLAIVFAEAYIQLGPQVGHIHLLTALLASLVAVLVDWAVGMIRGAVEVPRTRTAAVAR